MFAPCKTIALCPNNNLKSWVYYDIHKPLCHFLAALAALYLTLVSHSVSQCHFRILKQRVSYETWDPSDILSECCQDKKTKRQKDKKDKKTKRQEDKKKRQKDNNKKEEKKDNKTTTKKKKKKRQKDKRRRPKREFNIATSGQFCTLPMFNSLLTFMVCRLRPELSPSNLRTISSSPAWSLIRMAVTNQVQGYNNKKKYFTCWWLIWEMLMQKNLTVLLGFQMVWDFLTPLFSPKN